MPQKQPNRVPADPEGEPELRVPKPQMDQALEVQIAQGQELSEQTAELQDQLNRGRSIQGYYAPLRDKFYNWNEYNEELLRSRFSTGRLADSYRLSTGFGAEPRSEQQTLDWLPRDINIQLADHYRLLTGFGAEPRSEQQALDWLARDINIQLRKLGSIRQRLDLYEPVTLSDTRDSSASSHIGHKIFIVHGHDDGTKLQVRDFIERVTSKRPVILNEEADSGSRTIIEKFEELASEAGFAVVLLTADDEGKAKGAKKLNPRARQNVVLEFGYFMAKLGRGRVVALHEAGVELPSDVSGLLYKSLAGNWHTELARELKAAGIEIDSSKLF